MSSARIPVDPDVLAWALSYSQREAELRAEYRGLIEKWESGEVLPTWRQLETFAKKTRIPNAYIYGDVIPDLTVSDRTERFRTLENKPIADPSPGLTAMLRECYLRSDWYREYAENSGRPARDFVKSCKLSDDASEVAQRIKNVLGWSDAIVQQLKPNDYRQRLAEAAEEAGVLVMVDNVVGGDPDWRLDPDEFRGFSIADDWAPLAFINGGDSPSAQAYTLAHELAHIWLGEDGVSAPDDVEEPTNPVEQWCNAVAAELLAPTEHLNEAVSTREDALESIPLLEERFKLNEVVMLRCLRQARLISKTEFRSEFPDALSQSRAKPRPATMGRGRKTPTRSQQEAPPQGHLFSDDSPVADAAPYRSLKRPKSMEKVGMRFASAVYRDAKRGRTLFSDAYEMLGASQSDDHLEQIAELDATFK